MLAVKCPCGEELGLPDSFLRELLPCSSCGQPLTIVGRDDHAGLITARLAITTGPDKQGQLFILAGQGPIELGKLPTKDIALLPQASTPSRVSRNHCRLTLKGNTWHVEDLASTNGTLLNHRKLAPNSPHPLKTNDRLSIGEYELTFTSLAPVPATVPATGPSAPPEEEDGLVSFFSESPAEPALSFASTSKPPSNPPPATVEDDLFLFKDEVPAELAPLPSRRPASPVAKPKAPQTGGPTCPSCQRSLAPKAKICVDCGINIITGKALITAKGIDEDDLAIRCDTWIRLISWIVPLGLYPVASEAFGTRKPYVIWGTAVLTTIISIFFLIAINSNTGWDSYKNLMLWTGHPKAVVALSDESSTATAQLPTPAKSPTAAEAAPAEKQISEKDLDATYNLYVAIHKSSKSATPLKTREEFRADINKRMKEKAASNEDEDPDADSEKPLESGEFAPHQLLTSAFLHDPGSIGGFLGHLCGNMLFLLVFGSGINALIGTWRTLVVYPLLAICSSLIAYVAESGHALQPNLGASGAVMGLAGMYLVLFPVHKVHMAFWIRIISIRALLSGTSIWYKVWSMRGFWVVLFWISFDVIATTFGIQDGVGHWAHLGGFMSGMALALILLLTRQVNAGGGDILTALLGKKAWALLGKPADRAPTI